MFGVKVFRLTQRLVLHLRVKAHAELELTQYVLQCVTAEWSGALHADFLMSFSMFEVGEKVSSNQQVYRWFSLVISDPPPSH